MAAGIQCAMRCPMSIHLGEFYHPGGGVLQADSSSPTVGIEDSW
jgi:hypothetical protein